MEEEAPGCAACGVSDCLLLDEVHVCISVTFLHI